MSSFDINYQEEIYRLDGVRVFGRRYEGPSASVFFETVEADEYRDGPGQHTDE